MDHHAEKRGRPQYSIGCLLLITAVLALTIAGVSRLIHRRNAWTAEVERRTKQDVHTVKQVVIDVEEIRNELGRAPKDEAELESLMGSPLPKVHDNGYPTPINYTRTGDGSFMLQYELWATDDWIYDSTMPQAGWVQHWY